MPNVKAGDLAIIKRSTAAYNGRIVEVIETAPPHSFLLPDGMPHVGMAALSWVVKFIGGSALVRQLKGKTRTSWYAVADDRSLFPLPGDTEGIDVEEAQPVSEEAK